MSTMFDSAVYSMRRSVPFATPKPMGFISDAAFCNAAGDVVLTCSYRPSVSSRLWWTLDWYGKDGEKYQVSAQEWELCFWRAIQVFKQVERKMELESRPVTKGPGFFSAEAKGWEHGDGI